MNEVSSDPSRRPEERRWGMVVDVNRCVGCQTCTIACKHANDTVPGVQWRRVLDVETGTFPDVERVFMVVGCQHCAEPPCVPVCPTGATKQRADGLVTMDYDLCIGCASCAVACPYQARTIVHDKEFYFGKETLQEEAVAHDERFGVAQKCTFCIDRVDDGLAAGLSPGVDPDATPACAASCIASAIQFGDFNDPGSHVSMLVEENSHFQMHSELGTDPQIKYLYETPAVPGRDLNEADTGDEAMSDPANPLVGQPQPFWDMRAAMNFILGGFGGGMIVIAYLLYLFAGLDGATLAKMNLGAAGIIAVGLFFVWLKIGRKLRAPLAILRPQTSWMSREIYAVGVLYPAIAAGFLWQMPWLHLLAAVAALVFLYCQAKILHMAKGIPTWRVPMMPAMLVATGLYEGAGLSAIVFAVYGVFNSFNAMMLLVVLVLLSGENFRLWLKYTRTAEQNGIGPLSRKILKSATPLLITFGHLLPLVLAAIAFAWMAIAYGVEGLNRPWGGAAAWIAAAAGVFVLFGGGFWKALVITRACHQQGFAFAKFPRRGSGSLAAPSITDRG